VVIVSVVKMCNIVDKDFFEKLNIDYYRCNDKKEKITLRNAIMKDLLPILNGAVKAYSLRFNHSVFDEDLEAHLIEVMLTEIIPGWRPIGKPSEGYYRMSIKHRSINYYVKRNRDNKNEILVDPLDLDYWNTFELVEKGYTSLLQKHISTQNAVELGGIKGLAYEHLKALVFSSDINMNVTEAMKLLKNEFGLGRVAAREVYDQVLITCREAYGDTIHIDKLEIDGSSMFGRLCRYLHDDQIKEIVKIFGGVWIKVPEGIEK